MPTPDSFDAGGWVPDNQEPLNLSITGKPEPVLPVIPHGLGLGPNAIRIYADEMGLDLGAWETSVVTSDATGTYVHFERETTNHKMWLNVYPGCTIYGPVIIDKRKHAA